MDDKLLSITNAALGAGGMGVLLVFALKWFVGDYFKKADENRKLEKEAVDSRITDLRSVAGDLKLEAKNIKLEVSAMKDRILHTEKTMIQATERLSFQAERFDGLSRALEGFVATANERMGKTEDQLRVVESKADKAIVAIGQITRLKGGKSGGDES